MKVSEYLIIPKKEFKIEVLAMKWFNTYCGIRYLKETESKIERSKRNYRNHIKKKTKTPTMKCVLPIKGNTELMIRIDRKRIKKVLNLDEETIKILKLRKKIREHYVKK